MADNFCVMPFVHAFVTPNIISPCCAYSSDLRYNTKEQYWESDQLKAIQKNMLDNNRDPGCDISEYKAFLIRKIPKLLL